MQTRHPWKFSKERTVQMIKWQIFQVQMATLVYSHLQFFPTLGICFLLMKWFFLFSWLFKWWEKSSASNQQYWRSLEKKTDFLLRNNRVYETNYRKLNRCNFYVNIRHDLFLIFQADGYFLVWSDLNQKEKQLLHDDRQLRSIDLLMVVWLRERLDVPRLGLQAHAPLFSIKFHKNMDQSSRSSPLFSPNEL